MLKKTKRVNDIVMYMCNMNYMYILLILSRANR